MLDIGGNTCHVIHSAVKRFYHPFLGFMEKVLDDLNVNTKFSSEIKDYLQEICFMLSPPYLTRLQRMSHRWLSAYDCINKIHPMVDTLYVLHYSWGPKADKHLYKDELNALYTKHSVTEISHKRLDKIQKFLQVKSLTEKGKEHKLCLVEKLIEHRQFFVDCQPLCLFYHCWNPLYLFPKQKNTNIHRIHYLIVDNLKSLFGCFVKYESITNLT